MLWRSVSDYLFLYEGHSGPAMGLLFCGLQGLIVERRRAEMGVFVWITAILCGSCTILGPGAVGDRGSVHGRLLYAAVVSPR